MRRLVQPEVVLPKNPLARKRALAALASKRYAQRGQVREVLEHEIDTPLAREELVRSQIQECVGPHPSSEPSDFVYVRQLLPLFSKSNKVKLAIMLRSLDTETLEEIGDSYGLSRERIRQLRDQGWEEFRARVLDLEERPPLARERARRAGELQQALERAKQAEALRAKNKRVRFKWREPPMFTLPTTTLSSSDLQKMELWLRARHFAVYRRDDTLPLLYSSRAHPKTSLRKICQAGVKESFPDPTVQIRRISGLDLETVLVASPQWWLDTFGAQLADVVLVELDRHELRPLSPNFEQEFLAALRRN